MQSGRLDGRLLLCEVIPAAQKTVLERDGPARTAIKPEIKVTRPWRRVFGLIDRSVVDVV